MSDANLLSGWDTAVLMAPFAVFLAAWMFGVDHLLASPRARRRRAFSVTELSEGGALTDPDGKPWKSGHSERPVRRRWKTL